MYLKEFELRNFRKFYYNKDTSKNTIVFSNPNKSEGINIASRTSLILGANNCGKTTIVSCLNTLLNDSPNFKALDFNLDYLDELFKSYAKLFSPTETAEVTEANKSHKLPEIEFIFRIELDESNDLINNIAPFLNISNLSDKIVEITTKWEVREKEEFISKLKETFCNHNNYCSKSDKEKDLWGSKLREELLKLLSYDNFKLNYYNASQEIVKEFNIKELIRIKLINANKADSNICLSNALKKIITFRYKNETNLDGIKNFDDKLFEIGFDITNNMTVNYTNDVNQTFSKIIKSHSVGMKIDLTLDNLMNHLVKCEYLDKDKSIPEGQYGLGYTNLIVIISEIISYVDNYHEEDRNSQIHIIAIEEPETYMHPQMQELFIKKINDAVQSLLSNKKKEINSQLLITTHSSHMLNSKIHHGASLNNINYIRCSNDHPEIINLNDENIINPKKTELTTEPETEKEKELEFIKKHIKFKVSELFFADAAIFVEGITEYHLLQYYIDNDDILSTKTISLVLIDGAHAKVYETLIKTLGIPVAIITDLDIERNKKEKDECAQITILKGRTTNDTFENFYKSKNLEEISKQNYIKDKNMVICSQIAPIKGFYATSFEEAYILENSENKILNETLSKIKPEIYKICSTNNKVNIKNSFKLQRKLAKDKSLFANTLLFNILTGTDTIIPVLPKYITDAFDFIKEKLGD